VTSRRFRAMLPIAQAFVIALFSLATVTPVAADDVYLRSGWFNASHYDMMMPLWLDDMTIARTYNSSSYKGIFGTGWETRLETNLEVEDNGSIVVHEYGGGAYNEFSPTNKSARTEGSIAAELVNVAGESGFFGSNAELNSYKTWLQENHAKEWVRFRDLGLVVPQQSHAGETFSSGRFGENQVITRVPEGYQRVTEGGEKFEAFDLSGRLQRVWDVNRNFIALSYANGRLAEMSDNFGNRFAFSFTKLGFVEKIAASGGRTARFEYSGAYLTKVTDATGSAYQYTYDSLHRMTGIGYPDGKWKKIAYYSTKTDDTISDYIVKQIDDRDGSSTAYVYKKPDTGHYNVELTTTDAAGKVTHLEDRFVLRPGTGVADVSAVWDLDSVLTDGKTTKQNVYTSGKLTAITTPSGTTAYGYDNFGRPVTAKSAAWTITWVYDEATGHVSAAKREGANAESWQFAYDNRGNLAHATDSGGDDVTLSYDDHGRRIAAADNGQTLRFTYDPLFEPVKISLDGAGSAEIVYNEIGEIKRVSGSAGGAVDAKLNGLVKAIQSAIVPTSEDLLSQDTLTALGKAVAVAK
jgi:YD repeat-containing protein